MDDPNANVEGPEGGVVAGIDIPEADLDNWKAASNAPFASLVTRAY